MENFENKCHKCGDKGYKSDGNSDIWCKKCLGLLEPYQLPIIKDKKIQRNELCPCESDKKYKHCCGGKHKIF